MGDYAAKWEIHHIIPTGLAEHPLIKKLTNAKLFDIEGLENGTILPKFSTTRGLLNGMHASHPEYNKFVSQALDGIGERLKNGTLKSLSEARAEISKLNQSLVNTFEKIGTDPAVTDKRINEFFRELNK